jgi:hypothetical protein
MTALKRVSGDERTALAAALEQLYPPPAADEADEL